MRNAIAVLMVELCLIPACDGGALSEQEAVRALAVAPVVQTSQATTSVIELGRFLFWDPILSGDQDVACATCHHPDHAYADGVGRSRGVGAVGLGPKRTGGTVVDRNAPTVLNSGLIGADGGDAPMFWDNRADGLEEQALLPIQSGAEMRGNSISEDAILEVVAARVANNAEYRALFQAAFGTSEVTPDRIASAIADYERSLVASNSPLDRYLAGDTTAMSAQARRGMQRFAEAGCADCHSGPLLSDFETRSLGIATVLPGGGFDDGAGDGEFRTPSLRNVALTAPYMHDGSEETLRDVLALYRRISGGGGNNNDNNAVFQVDRDARNLRLNNGDTDDIIAFLQALTDPNFDRTVPTSVPSGLTPGGAIR